MRSYSQERSGAEGDGGKGDVDDLCYKGAHISDSEELDTLDFEDCEDCWTTKIHGRNSTRTPTSLDAASRIDRGLLVASNN
jgi:hypothetical protein